MVQSEALIELYMYVYIVKISMGHHIRDKLDPVLVRYNIDVLAMP